ncbi:hypothetical protein M9H77_34014 [Catharanthus roseus]|uniref:Uncharacterized protein n=1 Tax=Catharanthus roseus TaxID=4058 RepID=A0ACB9ZKU5_CATRO|nr:hypothetical protein M9H77_34014 [Catharanthus roseus]
MPRPKRRRVAARNNQPHRDTSGKNNGTIGRKMGSLSQGPQPIKKPLVSSSLNLLALSLTYQNDDRAKSTTSCHSQYRRPKGRGRATDAASCVEKREEEETEKQLGEAEEKRRKIK